MSNAALAFLAGLGGGYMKGKQYQDQKDRQDKIDQMAQETHDAAMAEVKRKQDADRALAEASKPVTVDNNAATVTGVAATPTVYDNADVAASDVRQANRLAAGDMPGQQNADGTPLTPPASTAPVASAAPAIAVQGKAYPDAGAAQAAAEAANTPQAVRSRQIAALNGIDPERALKFQAQATQVDQATQAAADAAWRRKVAGAMLNGGHQGLAELVSNSEHGPMAGVKLQAVPSADGKTVTYNKVGPDGTLTPTGLTFSNDGDGLARAAAALDGAISPADRVKMAQEDEKNALTAKKTGAEITELNARAGYYNAFANERQAKADGTGTDKPYKLDEDDRLRLTNSAKSVSDAQKQVQDALGKLMPGDDPAKNPAVVFAQNNLRQAKLEHLRTNIELGQIPPSSMATQILGVAKNPQDALKSLSELGGLVGPKYTDQVAVEIQNSDQWKQWTAKAAPKGGPVAARSGLPAPQGAASAGPDYGFGKRADGTNKGTGFLGVLKRPDGSVSTELSIGVNMDGKETEIPTLVPTLSKDEVNYLLGGGKPTQAIVQKAVDFARQRIAQGKSPFAQPGEGPQPASAAAPAAKSATVTPQSPQQAQATQELGKKLDQARQVLQQLQANRPPITEGRAALDAYGESVRAAQQMVDDLTTQYQASVQDNVPAFVGYRGVRARPAAAAGMTAGR